MHANFYIVFFSFWLECTCGQNLISEGAVCNSDSTIFLRHFLLILYINTIFFSLYIIANASWMKHKLETRLLGEISITSDADDTTLMAESEEELKSLLIKVIDESENLA